MQIKVLEIPRCEFGVLILFIYLATLSVTASTKGKGNASQRIAYPFQLNNEKKDEAEFNSENAYKTLVGEEKIKKGINFSSDMSLTNKVLYF